MTAIDKIGQMLPNVILDHVILRKPHPTATDSITVSLHFHIDEYIYSDGTGTWRTDADYIDKLAIECILDRGGFKQPVKVFAAAQHEPILLVRNEMNKVTYKKEIDILPSDISENMTISLRTSIKGTKTGIDWGEITPINLYGKPSSVEIVRGGTVQTRVLGYFLGAKFYNGPRFQLANGRWVTGNVQSPSSQPLIERNVPNIKLFDDRDLIKIGDLYDYITAGGTGPDITPNLPNFSHISATRDDKNTLKYLFTLDYSQAYEYNTLYRSVYSGLSPRLKDRLLRMSKLRNLTLFRKRHGYPNEVDEIIVSSGEVSGDNFIDTETEDGSIREEDFSFNEDLTYRTFSGVDKNFEDITAGKYQFRVSADIQDGIYTFLSFQIADLAVSKQLLDEYVAKYPTTSEELFAGHILEHGPTDKEIADYVNSVNAKTDFLNRPYIRALVSLSEAVYFLPGITGDKATRLINSFRSYLSPVTGDLSTLSAMPRIYNTISGQVHDKMDLVLEGNGTSLANPDASRGNLLYNIKETFPQVFDATESYKNGLNFLSSKSPSTTATNKVPGLYSATNPDFEARMARENKNFFKSANVTFSLGTGDTSLSSPSDDTSYSFLTPVSFRVGDTLYAVGSTTNITSETGTTAQPLLGGASENKYRMVLSSLRNARVADSGLGVENLDVSPVADASYESTAPIGEQTPENQTSLSINNLDNILSDAGFDNPLAALQLDETSTDEEGNITLLITGTDGTQRSVPFSTFNTRFPNYFKALLASEIPMGDTFSEIYSAAQSGNIAPYGLILGSMCALDVLTGYNSAGGGVRQPIYSPLTAKLYSQNAGKNILCRLSKFESSELGFRRSNNAPIYNHYFALECPPASAATANGLQIGLNAASTLGDINGILESYGISPSGGDSTDIGIDACGAIMDAQVLEEMADFIESTPEPLNLMPLVTGEKAPFDGILMDEADANAIISERDSLAKELEDLQGENN